MPLLSSGFTGLMLAHLEPLTVRDPVLFWRYLHPHHVGLSGILGRNLKICEPLKQKVDAVPCPVSGWHSAVAPHFAFCVTFNATV